MPLLWKNGGANFTDNLRIAIAQGQCLGGSTVINDAVCFKTPQIVINQWRDLGVNIPDIKWKNALDEVWGQINVEEVKDDELNRNNLMLKKACELRGYKASKNHRNCNDCMRCGFCHLGCHEIGHFAAHISFQIFNLFQFRFFFWQDTYPLNILQDIFDS